MNIRLATSQDYPEIDRIYAHARQVMRDGGNHSQWINGYPQRAMTDQDMADGHLYVVCGSEGVPHGVFYLAVEDDPTYEVIEDGAWPNQEPYAVIHRIASDGEIRGIFAIALSIAFQMADNVRIDTHEDNDLMQHVLDKHGFAHCGTIYCHDGSPRRAYHRCKN